MARVYGITIPAGIEIIWNNTINMYDISVFCNVGRNRRFLTRREKYHLKDVSKLLNVAYAWGLFSDAQKAAWYTAGDISGINGYALWTQDKIYRLMNSIAGNATPSIHHQYKIGHIKIEAPDSSAKLTEHHVAPFDHACTVKISYRSALVSAGGDSYAKLVFTYVRFTGGQTITESQEISLSLSSGWSDEEITITEKPGRVGGWKISLELNDVTGDLYFDNLFVEFNATIQNRDPFVDSFPKYFIQDDVGDNVTVKSIYCPDAIS